MALFNLFTARRKIPVLDPIAGRSKYEDELVPKSFQIGIVGTFDVENYGDLLFPLIAQAAFDQRKQPIHVVPFSPNSRSDESWPFCVESTLQFSERIPSLSALLVGGGQILRFDNGYPIPADPQINLPIDYWLTPAALAGKPVIWNAIGAWTGSPAAPWLHDLVNATFLASRYIGVRDKVSREHLTPIAPTAEIHILPDTAFSLARLWPLVSESREYLNWRKMLSVGGKYIVLQADPRLVNHWEAIDALIAKIGIDNVVLLPICRCHGDDGATSAIVARRKAIICDWYSPKLVSEIIGRSEFVIASSLHASITAISYGVPVVRFPSFSSTDRKFELLNAFEGVALIGDSESHDVLIRRGKKVEDAAAQNADQLDAYWNRVVDVVIHPDRHDSAKSVSHMYGLLGKMFANLEHR